MLARLLPLPAALLLLGALPHAARAAPGDPVFTRQNVFAIPFQVSPARTPAEAPKAVQLYVSADQGASWRLDLQLEPRAGRFPFRAPHDGEFWFQVRTIDANGRIVPQGQQPPGLKVIVDTVSPSVALTASEDKPGEIALQWRASDSLLDAGSLKIEAQGAAAGQWHPIAPNEADMQRTAQSNAGRGRFRVPDGSGDVTIRVEINDRAGNRASGQAVVRMAPRGGTAPLLSAPAAPTAAPPQNVQNVALDHRPLAAPAAATQPKAEAGVKPWPADNLAQQPPTSPSSGTTQDPPLPAAAPGAPQQPLVPLLPVPPAPTRSVSEAANTPARSASEGVVPSVGGASEPLKATRATEGDSPMFAPQTLGHSPSRSASEGAAAFARSAGNAIPHVPPANNEMASRALFDPSLLPAGVTPQRVNVLKFQVDYGVESVGPAGVGRVELWGTRDGGRTWQSFGLDNDNQSPLTAVVPGNGLYGFRIVVADSNGRGEPAPRTGDAPQVWIAVDASPGPKSTISGVRP